MKKNHTPTVYSIILAKYRTQRDLSQVKLGDLSGYDRSFINRLESGERDPSREAAERIARALGFTENDDQFVEMLDAAGYRIVGSFPTFGSHEIMVFNLAYKQASPEVQKELNNVLRFLTQSLNGHYDQP